MEVDICICRYILLLLLILDLLRSTFYVLCYLMTYLMIELLA